MIRESGRERKKRTKEKKRQKKIHLTLLSSVINTLELGRKHISHGLALVSATLRWAYTLENEKEEEEAILSCLSFVRVRIIVSVLAVASTLSPRLLCPIYYCPAPVLSFP